MKNIYASLVKYGGNFCYIFFVFIAAIFFVIQPLSAAEKVSKNSAQFSDAKLMGAEKMNPGNVLSCSERSSSGKFRVLIYGNSIALHCPAPNLGWHGNWGMAATSSEKDFAHLVIQGLEKKRGEKADFRIRNIALLEHNFKKDIKEYSEIISDIEYLPDYVVIAIGENVPNLSKKDAVSYTKMLTSLANAFTKNPNKPSVVMRSPFWKNNLKASCTAKAAKMAGVMYVDAGFLGSKNENKAIGLFSHKGVAAHPGDLGMRRIADLILNAFK